MVLFFSKIFNGEPINNFDKFDNFPILKSGNFIKIGN